MFIEIDEEELFWAIDQSALTSGVATLSINTHWSVHRLVFRADHVWTCWLAVYYAVEKTSHASHVWIDSQHSAVSHVLVWFGTGLYRYFSRGAPAGQSFTSHRYGSPMCRVLSWKTPGNFWNNHTLFGRFPHFDVFRAEFWRINVTLDTERDIIFRFVLKIGESCSSWKNGFKFRGPWKLEHWLTPDLAAWRMLDHADLRFQLPTFFVGVKELLFIVW